MNQYLDTLQPELMNVTRLFRIPDQCWEQPRFTWEAWEAEGRYHCRMTDGEQSAEGAVDIPDDGDERIRELHRKRAARRLCKQTMYDLCRKVTGEHPAWGSLTGIRPTHLMYEALAQGMDMDEAAAHLIRTFDVTEEKARLLQDIVRVQSQLPPPEDGWMDVYIGIPFCTTRCTYCSFSSGELGKGKLVEP